MSLIFIARCYAERGYFHIEECSHFNKKKLIYAGNMYLLFSTVLGYDVRLVGALCTSTDGLNEQQHDQWVGGSVDEQAELLDRVTFDLPVGRSHATQPANRRTRPGLRPSTTPARRRQHVDGLRIGRVPESAPSRSTVDGLPLSVNVSSLVSDDESGSIMPRDAIPINLADSRPPPPSPQTTTTTTT